MTAAAIAVSDAETASLPFITPPPRGLVLLLSDIRPHYEPCTRLAKTYAVFAFVVNSFGNFLHCLAQCHTVRPWFWRLNGPVFLVLDPSDGSVIETLESASPQDGLAAVDAAAGAAEAWASRAPRERAEILRNAYELMTERLDEVAIAIVREMGKPFVEARGEAGYAAEFLRWFSEEAVRATGDYGVAPAGTNRMLVAHAPVGVSLLITPWNFPAAMATRKIGAGARRGLHRGAQARRGDAAHGAADRRHPGRSGRARGRRQRRRHRRARTAVRGHPRRPAGPQAELHGLHGGRPAPARPGRPPRHQHVDGARRQRAVPGARRRGPRRRGARGHGGEDAQRRRGVHRRQPLPRARVGRGGLRGPAHRGDARRARGAWLRGRRRSSGR